MITRKKKNGDFENDNLSIPQVQVFEDVDGEDEPKVDAKYVSDLERELKRLQESKDDDRDERLLYLDNRSGQSQTMEAPVEVKVDSVPLPDPALDPDGFSVANNKRTQIVIENERRKHDFETKRKADIDNKIKGLWTSFNADYEEYADDQVKLEFVTQQVLNEATRKGIDAQRYMFTTQNKFFRDVAKKYDEVFGVPEAEADNGQYEEDIPRRSRREASASPRRQPRDRNRSQDDEGRSAGIFGGNESGGRPARRQDEDDVATDMISELQKTQRKMGLY